MQPRIPIDAHAISDFCKRWNLTELLLFGSVLRDDFRADSDVDVLVEFAPEARPEFVDLEDMATELSAMFGRPVDVVTKKWLKPFVREEVLASSMQIYAA